MDSPGPFQLPSSDGWDLAADLFVAAQAPRAAVVIGSALGARRQVYRRIARHLADRGAFVLSFDYRGIAESRMGPAAPVPTMLDWGRKDLQAAFAFMHEHYPSTPLRLLGHSAGGHLFGLAPSAGKLDRAALVATGLGNWQAFSGWQRHTLRMIWSAVPLITRGRRWLPRWILPGGQVPLPASVVRQWATWGRQENYLFSAVPGAADDYARLRTHVHAVTFGDDWMAPPESMQALLRMLKNARINQQFISAREQLGHFGFFRQPDAWPTITDFLLAPADKDG